MKVTFAKDLPLDNNKVPHKHNDNIQKWKLFPENHNLTA